MIEQKTKNKQKAAANAQTSANNNADAAEKLPVGTFIVGEEHVAVGRAQVDLLDVVRIRFEGNDGAARRAALPPGLCRRKRCRRQSKCC